MDESGRWWPIVVRKEDCILCFRGGRVDRRRWAGISSEREPESSKQDGADMEPTCKNSWLSCLEEQISLII